jgi:hypothetical protein
MYNFAIVALLGLAIYKTVDFVLGLLGIELPTAIKTFVTLGLGVVATELLDYSVFAAWGVKVRTTWMGPFFTGLMVGAMTYVWHATLGYVSRASGGKEETTGSRTPRAA